MRHTGERAWVLGHRGLTGAQDPENSLAAIEKASEYGFDGVEVDVQITKDKKLILWHNELLGGRPVHEWTLAECQEKVRYPLATMASVLSSVKSLGLFLMCELKVYEDTVYTDLCHYLREMFSQNMPDESMLLFSSFHLKAVEYMHQVFPNIPCALATKKKVVPASQVSFAAIVHPVDIPAGFFKGYKSILYGIKRSSDPFVHQSNENVFAAVVDGR